MTKAYVTNIQPATCGDFTAEITTMQWHKGSYCSVRNAVRHFNKWNTALVFSAVSPRNTFFKVMWK